MENQASEHGSYLLFVILDDIQMYFYKKIGYYVFDDNRNRMCYADAAVKEVKADNERTAIESWFSYFDADRLLAREKRQA